MEEIKMQYFQENFSSWMQPALCNQVHNLRWALGRRQAAVPTGTNTETDLYLQAKNILTIHHKPRLPFLLWRGWFCFSSIFRSHFLL